LPIDEYFDLAVVYGRKATWIEFNGQCCYHTGKAPYLELLKNDAIPDEFANGFDFAIVCGGDVSLSIKSMTITEYENDEPAFHDEIAKLPELSAFDWYVKSLPCEVRNEVVKTDEFLMKDMKSTLKFKKSIDKDGKVTYTSPHHFFYTMQRHRIGESHYIGWNRYWDTEQNKPIWYGNFGEILGKLAESSPAFANRMFDNIHRHRDGHGCQQCAHISCANMATIEFDGNTKQACCGAMQFKWQPSDFEDVRKVVTAIFDVMQSSNDDE